MPGSEKHRGRVRRTIIAAVGGTLLLAAAGAAATPPPFQVAFKAFGSEGLVEIRDLPTETAAEAARHALAAIEAVELLTDVASPQSALSILNTAAGKGRQTVAPQLAAELGRALEFCLWSDRRHGPLAGEAYRLTRAGIASDAQLDDASQLTDCRRLEIDVNKHTANLAAGSRLDLTGFSPGLAIDDAIEALRKRGVTNAQVRLGSLWRAMGVGADGKGWWVVLPALPGSSVPPERVCLRNEAMVALRRDDPPLAAGPPTPHYLDGRSGHAPRDVLAVFLITPLAANALPLAVTMYIAGSRQGELLVGSVNPPPAVLWVEGSGTGEPLWLPHHWAEVVKPQ